MGGAPLSTSSGDPPLSELGPVAPYSRRVEPPAAPGTDQVTISVIIVSWNTRDLLLDCLARLPAALGPLHTRAEVIVVDNASTDGTVEAVRARFPTTRVLPLTTNHGFAVANNAGIAVAAGETICLLNPDTAPRPGSLALLARHLDARPEVGLVGPRLLNADGTEQAIGFKFPTLVQVFLDFFPLGGRLAHSTINGRYPDAPRDRPFPVDFPLGACMVVRRTVFETAGRFDPGYFMYAEEVDLARRVHTHGWQVHCLPTAEVVHYGGQSTTRQPAEMFVELHRSRARYFRRHESFAFVVVARCVTRIGAIKGALGAWREYRQGVLSPAAFRARVRACGKVFRL